MLCWKRKCPREISSLYSVMALLPCPESPNCVQSINRHHKSFVEPIVLSADQSQLEWQKLCEIVTQLPRTRLISADEHYLHIEFRSRLFRFVDDVELVLNLEQGLVHLRSASRLGYSDFGVNRRRVQKIKRLFEQLK